MHTSSVSASLRSSPLLEYRTLIRVCLHETTLLIYSNSTFCLFIRKLGAIAAPPKAAGRQQSLPARIDTSREPKRRADLLRQRLQLSVEMIELVHNGGGLSVPIENDSLVAQNLPERPQISCDVGHDSVRAQPAQRVYCSLAHREDLDPHERPELVSIDEEIDKPVIHTARSTACLHCPTRCLLQLQCDVMAPQQDGIATAHGGAAADNDAWAEGTKGLLAIALGHDLTIEPAPIDDHVGVELCGDGAGRGRGAGLGG